MTEDRSAVEDLAWTLLEEGQGEASAQRFRELLEGERAPRLLAGLALAETSAERFAEAARAYDELYALAPGAASDPVLLTQAMDVRRRAGLPLAPPEEAYLRRTRIRRVAIPLLVLGVLGFGGLGVHAADRTVRVVVDNPTDRPVALQLDGAPWLTVAPRSHARTSLARGKHRVEGAGDALEVVAEPSLAGNVFGSATLVLDPSGEGAYVLHEVIYGDRGGTPRAPEYHICERAFELAVVDHVLVDPPASIRMRRGSTERRTVLARLPRTGAPGIASYLIHQGRPGEAVAFLQRHLERDAQDPNLFGLLRYAATASGRDDAVEAWLAGRRTPEPASLHFHRFYQDEALSGGRHAALEREYAKLRAAHPERPMSHYLWGRVAPTGEAALEAYDQALALEPGFVWARLARGHELVAMERWDDALAALPRGRGLREEAAVWAALAHAGRYDELEAATRPLVATPGEEGERATLACGRALILSGSTGWASFIALAKRRAESGAARILEVERDRWTGNLASVERALRDLEAQRLTDDAGASLVGVKLQAGDLAAAEVALEAALAKSGPGGRAATAAILVAIAAEWAGDLERARRAVSRAAEVATDWHDHEVCRFLEGRASAEALARTDRWRSPEGRAVSVLARALRDAAGREKLLDVAARLAAAELAEPAFLVRHVLSRRSPAPR